MALKFEDIVDGKIGYVLDRGAVIVNETITEATETVTQNIDKLVSDISEGSKEVTKFYIGKSHFRTRSGKRIIDPKNPHTWRLDNGINGRYQDHRGQPYGQNGLLVVAVITSKSIPENCKAAGYIIHQEEYALVLEKRLIQKYKDDPMLANKPSYRTGNTDDEKSIGYVIYIAFSTKGKWYHECSDHI